MKHIIENHSDIVEVTAVTLTENLVDFVLVKPDVGLNSGSLYQLITNSIALVIVMFIAAGLKILIQSI